MIVDKGQDPRHGGLLRLRRHAGSRSCCASTASTRSPSSASPRTTASAHRARRAARGLRRHRRPGAVRGVDVEPGDARPGARRAARPRGGGATPCAAPRRGSSRSCAPHVADERVLHAIARGAARPLRPGRPRAGRGTTCALPIGRGQTISQPLVVARMCELLALRGDERVLDVGTGSGYHAARARPPRPARSHGVEVHAGARASRRAERLARSRGRRVTLVGRRRIARAARHAPFDAINVAAAGRAAARTPLVRAARARRPARRAGRATGDQRLALVRRSHGGELRRSRTSGCASSRWSADGARGGGSGCSSRPTFAHGRPSTITTSAVKSFAPRISDDPTP